jgi:hypothetical protein
MSDSKPTLETNVQELLGLFPRKLERLDVIATPYGREGLRVVYLQRNTYDVRRDWDAYQQWKVDDRIHMQEQEGLVKVHLLRPGHIDGLYHVFADLFEQKLISSTDRLLLSMQLWDYDPQKEVVIIGIIQRNMSQNLKGLGKEFYANLSGWLRDKGFKYLAGLPINKNLRDYWRGNGFLPWSELPDEHKKILQAKPDMGNIMLKGDVISVL